MLKDQSHKHSTIGKADLTVSANHAVSVLLEFIEKRIEGFRDYYFGTYSSQKENFITNHLVNYFNAWLSEDTGGYAPYKFSFQKNPAQEQSSKETDMGIVLLNQSMPTNTIFEFEAKRLSDSSNNTEYVYGERGGIERFKRNHHASHLTVSGMLGYVQTQTAPYWIEKINEWITKCSKETTDADIDWSRLEELITKDNSGQGLNKCKSQNTRSKNTPIQLFHYFLDMVPNKGV